MSTPTWREIAKIDVPAEPGVVWTPALDYVTPGKLYLIKVDPDANGNAQKWSPESGEPCTADGDASLTQSTTAAPLPGCSLGALIARIGGSTADMPGDKEKLLLFSAGRHCVFLQPADTAKSGALYLGVNDASSSAAKLKGKLVVHIYSAL
jgi:hypothetical protein